MDVMLSFMRHRIRNSTGHPIRMKIKLQIYSVSMPSNPTKTISRFCFHSKSSLRVTEIKNRINTQNHRHQSAVDWRKRSKNNIIEPARTHGPIQAKQAINTQSHSDSALFLYQFIFTFYLFHCRMRSCCRSCEINNNHISLSFAIVIHLFIRRHTTI